MSNRTIAADLVSQSPCSRRLKGERAGGAAGLADAPGGALSARISRAAGREGRVPRAGLRQRGRGRGHAPADPPLRVRRRDPVLRHPDRARTRWGRICGSRRAKGRGSRRRWSMRALDALEAGAASGSSRSTRPCARVAAALPPETTLLGFAGSPWTVATYMVAGQGSRRTRARRARWPIAIRRRSARSIDAIADADDRLSRAARSRPASRRCSCSTAGRAASPRAVRALGDRAQRADRRAAAGAHARACRSSAFPRARRQAAGLCARDRRRCDRARRDGRSGLGACARCRRPAGAGQSRSARADRRRRGAATARSTRILAAFAERPHVFNLGHGILPDTPIAHVERLLARVRAEDATLEWIARRRLSAGSRRRISSS